MNATQTTVTALPAWVIRDWDAEQRKALNTAGSPALMVARGMVVTVIRMDVPALREWSWITDEWEGRTFGDLRGYTIAGADGRELGIVLVRGRLAHAEWLNPTTGDYEFAGQVRTLQIAANYILDRHDYLARTAGTPRHAEDDTDVRVELIAQWWASWRPVPPAPVTIGDRVVYQGSLTAQHGVEFTVHTHDHMFSFTDLDDDCACTSGYFTLVAVEGSAALLHVHRSHFVPAA